MSGKRTIINKRLIRKETKFISTMAHIDYLKYVYSHGIIGRAIICFRLFFKLIKINK